MNNKKCNIDLAIFIVKLLIEIANFVCICILVNSSKKNPFESHIIGNLENYFYVEDTNKIDNLLINKISTEEHIHDKNKTITSNLEIKNETFLRKLISKSTCLEIRENFEKFRGTKLSNIFDLNYSKVHAFSIATLILTLVLFAFIIFNSILSCTNWYYFSFNSCKKCFMILYLVIFLLVYGARFVLFLVLFYYMEKGDLDLYDDFLDCKDVKANVFKKISDINKLRNCFYTFVILNFVELGIEKIEKYLEFSEKNIEEGKKQNS